jgi:hypothetical protein
LKNNPKCFVSGSHASEYSLLPIFFPHMLRADTLFAGTLCTCFLSFAAGFLKNRIRLYKRIKLIVQLPVGSSIVKMVSS